MDLKQTETGPRSLAEWIIGEWEALDDAQHTVRFQQDGAIVIEKDGGLIPSIYQFVAPDTIEYPKLFGGSVRLRLAVSGANLVITDSTGKAVTFKRSR